MKTLMYAVILVVYGFLAACTGTVQTYDAAGQLTGKCEATRYLITGGAHCYGSANP